jgi:hypothetical protein
MIVYLVAIPLIVHGLANLAGVFSAWAKSMNGFINTAWIFSTGVILKSGIGQAFSLVWLASTLCLAIAGAGVFLHQPWWKLVAILGCAFSLAAILTWWKAVPGGARFGAIFDLVVIALLASPLGERIAQAVK